ncbi:hypothetical protein OsI_38631 [Oryza sativa Indica Group]|uniref:Uncharacterized protein n=1 Tax=Oryza sativa subsp. indica TaxID=39946 RepID=B8BMC8_ORYSI|nr:hypothetical protein OsI_38631 [Oryza sativa Indica Group]
MWWRRSWRQWRRTAVRAATPALVKNLAATREARRPRQCSGCECRARDAFLHDAGDPRFALHLRSVPPRPDLDGWRLAALDSDGGGWTVVAGQGCSWRWRWRWRWWLTVAAVNAPAVNAVPVTPSSMMLATCVSRCTSDPRYPGRIWTAGVWRRWLATVVADGGGWTGVSVAVAVVVAMVADGGGWRRWWLW